jgi:hypothetical protein
MSRLYQLFFTILSIVLSSILLISCSKFDKAEPIPSYISVSSIDLIVPDSLKTLQGTSSAKISDAWVFIDDKLQGIYELPAKFPVLQEGTFSVKIKPGIKQNGIGSTRPIYPFYTEQTESVTLSKEKITNLKANVYYRDFTQFVWKENFEGAAVSLTKTSNSDTTYKITTDPQHVFEGQKSLVGYLDETHRLFEYRSTLPFVLNTNGLPVFLELNYKTNSPIDIGFLANSSVGVLTQPVLTLNATFNDNNELYWNKIYINLTDFIGDYYQSDNFNILFRVEKPAGAGNSVFYLDNIKLVQ